MIFTGRHVIETPAALKGTAGFLPAGVPLLKDIPVLGWVFSTETETTRHSELVLIARAEIAGPFDNAPDDIRADISSTVAPRSSII